MIDMNTIKLPTRFSKLSEKADESRFIPVRIYIAHTGENLNNSVFSKEVLEGMIPTLANIPILGYVTEDKDGNEDFRGHEKRVSIDGTSVNISYKTHAYGFVPEDNNAHFEITGGKEWLVADGYLWSRFVDVLKIFDESDGTKGQSMEVSHADGYTDRRGRVVFTSAQFEGLCILGDNIPPAMTGSVISAEFSKSDFKSAFKEMLAEFTAEKGESALATKKKQKEEAVVVDTAKTPNSSDSASSSATEPAKSSAVSSASKPAENPASDKPAKAEPAKEDKADEESAAPAVDEATQDESADDNVEISKDEDVGKKEKNEDISLPENESASKDQNKSEDNSDEEDTPKSDDKKKNEKAQFELSLSEREMAFVQAVRKQFGQSFDWISPEVIYEDRGIVRCVNDNADKYQYLRVDYTVNADDSIQLGDKTEVFPTFLTAKEKAKVEEDRTKLAQLESQIAELTEYKNGIEMSAKQGVLDAHKDELTKEQADGIKAQFEKLTTEEVEKEVAYAIFTTQKEAPKARKGMRAANFSAKEDYGYGTANELFRRA
ncbi:hypothetical protein [Limosilactobacillus reuteri]|uniref:hypothetical protein n=1 Tax=Limosilactobacillus reuteri TaxID=1598 RepID=UPI001E4C4538|nr:hypothetical protein [Limosilactobacillus reuteri]MCC4466851.1 hypothetical protein [Limosilactobacillus reuteri]MCC4472903.1 hypothetical protein [Limosilactobacillus reuteri]